MTELKRISGIDINQDMDYQWREWRIQRIAWVFFGAILLAALLGLLGQGPLSKGRIATPDGAIALDFERIDRANAPTGLTVTLAPDVAQGGAAQVAFSREFMERISIEEVVPEPQSVETGAGEVIYTFNVEDPSQPASVRLDFQYEQAGLTHGSVRLADGPALRFEAFVWP